MEEITALDLDVIVGGFSLPNPRPNELPAYREGRPMPENYPFIEDKRFYPDITNDPERNRHDDVNNPALRNFDNKPEREESDPNQPTAPEDASLRSTDASGTGDPVGQAALSNDVSTVEGGASGTVEGGADGGDTGSVEGTADVSVDDSSGE